MSSLFERFSGKILSLLASRQGNWQRFFEDVHETFNPSVDFAISEINRSQELEQNFHQINHDWELKPLNIKSQLFRIVFERLNKTNEYHWFIIVHNGNKFYLFLIDEKEYNSFLPDLKILHDQPLLYQHPYPQLDENDIDENISEQDLIKGHFLNISLPFERVFIDRVEYGNPIQVSYTQLHGLRAAI